MAPRPASISASVSGSGTGANTPVAALAEIPQLAPGTGRNAQPGEVCGGLAKISCAWLPANRIRLNPKLPLPAIGQVRHEEVEEAGVDPGQMAAGDVDAVDDDVRIERVRVEDRGRVGDVVEADFGAEDVKARARAADRNVGAVADGQARVRHVEERRCLPAELREDSAVRGIPGARCRSRLVPIRPCQARSPHPATARREQI